MTTYILEDRTGRLRPKKEGQAEKKPELWIMTKEEFREIPEALPNRKNLLHAMDSIQYCKVEAFRSSVQGTMKVPQKSSQKAPPLTFAFYSQEERLILIGEEAALKSMVEKLRNGNYEITTLHQLSLLLFEQLIEGDVPFLLKLEEQLGALEEEVLQKAPDNFYETIMEYRKKLSELHAYYEQLMDMGDDIQESLNRRLSEEERIGWQHYTNRGERLHNHVEMLREYLVQIRELYQSQIEVSQNKVMSFLTVVTTLFLPLTLIAGWYGMNFAHMPEYSWQLGYPVVIIISVIIIILEIIYFKWKKML